MGILSFNGNKIITTGGGGAILTDDADLARHAKHLTTTTKRAHRWEFFHDEPAWNYRLPNLNAALGCAQIEHLPDFIAAKRKLFEAYTAAFADVPQARIVSEPAGCRSNYWLQAMLLDEDAAGQRDAVLAATNAAGCMTRPVWTLMHEMAHFAACPRMPLPTASSLAQRLINIPSSPALQLGRT